MPKVKRSARIQNRRRSNHGAGSRVSQPQGMDAASSAEMDGVGLQASQPGGLDAAKEAAEMSSVFPQPPMFGVGPPPLPTQEQGEFDEVNSQLVRPSQSAHDSLGLHLTAQTKEKLLQANM